MSISNAATNSSLVDLELPGNSQAHQLSQKQLANRRPSSPTELVSYWPIASGTVGEPGYFRTAITSVLAVAALIQKDNQIDNEKDEKYLGSTKVATL